MIRSNYTYNTLNDVLYIIDENLGGMSVTNNMEDVLEAIREDGIDLQNYKIMYKDSEGIWDGVRITKYDPIEIIFFSIGTTDFHEAYDKISDGVA